MNKDMWHSIRVSGKGDQILKQWQDTLDSINGVKEAINGGSGHKLRVDRGPQSIEEKRGRVQGQDLSKMRKKKVGKKTQSRQIKQAIYRKKKSSRRTNARISKEAEEVQKRERLENVDNLEQILIEKKQDADYTVKGWTHKGPLRRSKRNLKRKRDEAGGVPEMQPAKRARLARSWMKSSK